MTPIKIQPLESVKRKKWSWERRPSMRLSLIIRCSIWEEIQFKFSTFLKNHSGEKKLKRSSTWSIREYLISNMITHSKREASIIHPNTLRLIWRRLSNQVQKAWTSILMNTKDIMNSSPNRPQMLDLLYNRITKDQTSSMKYLKSLSLKHLKNQITELHPSMNRLMTSPKIHNLWIPLKYLKHSQIILPSNCKEETL